MGVSKAVAEKAFEKATQTQNNYVITLAEQNRRIVEKAKLENRMVILLAGRPYHIDPLIQHKIADYITDMGIDVITENISLLSGSEVFDEVYSISQWAYPNRILKAAHFVANSRENIHFVELTSFGCGPDAFVIDEISEVLKRKGKSLTLLKIDDVNNTIETCKGVKNQVRNNLSSIIGSKIFHLEQVFAMDYEKEIDIIYLGVANIENVKKLDNNYQLIDFKVENNNTITFGNDLYSFKTIEIENYNNIEYIHEIKTDDVNIKRTLLDTLISYKRIRVNADSSDIIFKFMGSSFTLEDVRILYEMVKDIKVDKSNFRKKIIKYCEKIEDAKTDKKIGFRPSQKYRFKLLREDIWI